MDRSEKIIVSLTSFPARINAVYKVVENILSQTKTPDRILLWLSDSQFPKKEEVLPAELLKQREKGLEIRWCPDIRPHKKYLFAMREYPEDILITVDDDLVYPPDMIECLYDSYQKHPKAVSAMRCHVMVPGEDGFYPYSLWLKECSYLTGQESMHLFATNGAGTLFPPHIIDPKYLDEDLVKELCLNADDLWLKCAEILEDIPTVLVREIEPLIYLEGSQEQSLKSVNMTDGNDAALRKIEDWVIETYGSDVLLEKMKKVSIGADLNTAEHLIAMGVFERNRWRRKAEAVQRENIKLKNEKQKLEEELKDIRDSKAYQTALKMRKILGK